MFRLELEVELCFDPPMDHRCRGIALTRPFVLPFPPTDGMVLIGKAIDETPCVDGLTLKDIAWDVDREVFLATTSHSYHGFPIAMIPDEIRSWISRGWKFGSLQGAYEQDLGSDDDEVNESDGSPDEWEIAEEWPALSPRSQPRHFKKLMQAIVREMVALGNNTSVAYAIDKTRMFFEEHDLKGDLTPAKSRFTAALAEHAKMTYEQHQEWEEAIKTRKGPRLDRIVAQSP